MTSTLYVLVILFANDAGGIEGTSVKFPTAQMCKAGAEQAKVDFAPMKIHTICTKMEVPGDSPVPEQKKKKELST